MKEASILIGLGMSLLAFGCCVASLCVGGHERRRRLALIAMALSALAITNSLVRSALS